MKSSLILAALVSTAVIQNVAAQSFAITGNVRATDGTPLNRVMVRIVETGRRAFTDSTGAFTLDSASTGIVEFSLAGRRSVQQCLEARTTIDMTMELDERGWWARLRAGSPVRVATGGRVIEGEFTQLQNERLLLTASGSLDSIPIRNVQRLWQRGSAIERGARIGGAAGAVGLALYGYMRARDACEPDGCTNIATGSVVVGSSFVGATAGALIGAFVGKSFRSWVRVHP